MIVFSLSVVIPEPLHSGFRSSIATLIEPTRVAPGCTACRLLTDCDNANAFTLIEEWVSQSELDRHLASDACKTLISVIEMSSEPPMIRFDSVVQSAGLEVIESARHVDRHQ